MSFVLFVHIFRIFSTDLGVCLCKDVQHIKTINSISWNCEFCGPWSLNASVYWVYMVVFAVGCPTDVFAPSDSTLSGAMIIPNQCWSHFIYSSRPIIVDLNGRACMKYMRICKPLKIWLCFPTSDALVVLGKTFHMSSALLKKLYARLIIIFGKEGSNLGRNREKNFFVKGGDLL